MSGKTVICLPLPHNFKCRTVWSGSHRACMSSCVVTGEVVSEEIWKDTPLHTNIHKYSSVQLNLNYCKLALRTRLENGQNSFNYAIVAKRKGTALQGGITIANLYAVDRFIFST